MPLYGMRCPGGHTFDVFGHMEKPPKTAKCTDCGVHAHRDYSPATLPQVGMIDGPTTGYFPSDMGFPSAGDPRHPRLKICPSKRAWANAKKDKYEDCA